MTRNPISLASNAYWELLTWDDFETNEATVRYQILYKKNNEYVPIANSILKGNEEGFTKSPIFLSSLSDDYPEIKIRAKLTTTDSSMTPKIFCWTLTWQTLDHWHDLFSSEYRIDAKNQIDVENGVNISFLTGDWPMFSQNPENTRVSTGKGAFFDSHPHAQSCYCLLFAERQLKTVFTTRQLGDGIPQEMATTSVTFAEPLPCLPTADEADLRGQIAILVFNGVTRAAVALLAKRRKDRKAVEEQQALLTLRMRLARDAGKCLDSLMAGGDQTDQVAAALQRGVAEVERRAAALPGRTTELEHAFQEVVAVYVNPESHVYVSGIDICVDRMNPVAPECRYDGAKVRLLEATGPRGTRVALVARYARADVLPLEAVFLDAVKALA